MKICYKCKRELPVDLFGKCKIKKDGLDIWCKECKSENSKQYYKVNRVSLLQTSKEYQHNNIEKVLNYSRNYRKENLPKVNKGAGKYRSENKPKVAAASRKWRQENKIRVNILCQRSQARRKLLPSTLTAGQWADAKLYFDNRCCYCGRKLSLEMEHWVPVTNGGGYVESNIIPACKSCNCSKNNSDFFTWFKAYKFYNEERENKIIEFLNSKALII